MSPTGWRETPPPPLCCPACGAAITHRGACAGCGRRWGMKATFPDFVMPETVGRKDRLLHGVYQGLGRWHDPALKIFMAKVDGTGEAAVRDRIASLFAPLMPASRLLDVGCGSGGELLSLSRRWPSARLYGVDLSLRMLERGWERTREAGIRPWLALADAHRLPFPDDSFDGVLHVGAVNNFSDRRRALAEMVRVAKPGAGLLIVDEQLDGGSPQGLRHRAAFRALTWYDRQPAAPVDELPGNVADVEVTQVSRFYYAMRFYKSAHDDRDL